ncbi:MAG: S1 RNA-binding domain-containing protein [Dehalococcoidia bacterium]|nr:MAG: S1 RNA-binding domain-containing protein [Dehalococcoidia bacterium]
METTKRVFVKDVWPEVYASYQSRGILQWPVTGVEQHTLKNGDIEEDVLCLIVSREDSKGMIPLHETGITVDEKQHVNRSRLAALLGQPVSFVVTYVSQREGFFTASRSMAMKKMAANIWPSLKEGQVRTAIARRVKFHEAEVEINGVIASLPSSELTHAKLTDARKIVKPGDVFDVKIIGVDHDNQKLVVSIKDFVPDPWADVKYVEGGIYAGVVTGFTPRYGIFVNLEPGVDVLCWPLKFGEVKKGDGVKVVVDRIDMEKRRMSGKVRSVV